MSRIVVSVLLFVGVLASGAQEGSKSFADPQPRTEAILKLFVAEFIILTPGEGRCPAKFRMGTDAGDKNEQPVHEVVFKHKFALAKYEVTQELYQAVMGKNPSRWQGPRNAVEMVTWSEAVDFCERAAKELRQRQLIAADESIRLPSEAEWEYACRAGTTTAYSFGDDAQALGLHGWYKGNAAGNDPPVGAKRANPWGLHDMHGYLWEWCQDRWHDDYEKAPSDGSAWMAGNAARHVLRGGAWTDDADAARSAARRPAADETRSAAIGFRCVKTKPR